MAQTELGQIEREIMRKWTHLPYRQYVSRPEDAVELLLSQFLIAKEQLFQASGELFLYTEDKKLAGIRYLQVESDVLKAACGRMEPLIVTSENELNRGEIERTAKFIKKILNQSKMLDHISTPVTPADTNGQLALNELGFKMADTILGYHLNLSLVSDSQQADEQVRPATENDVEQISRIASRCFSNRCLSVNRFNSEPLFAADNVGELYASWTRESVLSGNADLTLVYEDGSSPAGFMTFKEPTPRERAAGLMIGRAILSAVDPDCHKRGIYRKLLHGGCLWLKKKGAQWVEGKTQLSTVPVHRVWQSMGATLQIAYHTYHYRRA
jgi:hypothetical protein